MLCTWLLFHAHAHTKPSRRISLGLRDDISIVHQCKELELQFGTHFLDRCLAAPNDVVAMVQEAKHSLIKDCTISLAST